MKTPRIFLSYRRADAGSYTGHLYRDLGMALGKAHVFRDREGLEPGTEFPDALRLEVDRADAVLAVIGPDWAGPPDPSGQTRIQQEKDWVRKELELALEGKKILIPVLVGGCEMPAPGGLPESLRPLCNKNAVTVRDAPDWLADLEPLILQLVGEARSTRAIAALRSEPGLDPKALIAWVPLLPAPFLEAESGWLAILAGAALSAAIAAASLWDLRVPGRRGHWIAWSALVAAVVIGVGAVWVRASA